MKNNFLAKDVENCSFIVLFGTQLGNAGSIAEGVVETGKSSPYNWTSLLYSFNQIKDLNELAKVRCPIVIITSTTGDGEAPENADRFWRQVHKKSVTPGLLHSIKYALLGLGDTNFNNFCNCGKLIHKRFQELKAESFYPPGWADDAVGTQLVVDGWLEGLWPALKKIIEPSLEEPDLKRVLCRDSQIAKPLGLQNQKAMDPNFNKLEPNAAGDCDSPTAAAPTAVVTLPTCPAVTLSLNYQNSQTVEVNLESPPAPYPLLGGPVTKARLVSAKCLTKEHALKTTLEVTFHTEKFDFEPGDAVGIVCPNSSEEVNMLLDRLGVSEAANKSVVLEIKAGVVKGKFPAHIPKVNTTLRSVFLNYCDLRATPKKNFIRLLAESTIDAREKSTLLQLCSKEGSTEFDERIRIPGLSLLDILMKFPSCEPAVEAVIEHLPRLIPRAYSITSSPLNSGSTFSIAFNIIHIPKDGGRQYSRLGVCTGWLYEVSKEALGLGVPQPENLDAVKCLPPTCEDYTLHEIFFYKRKNHNFRLPKSLTSPVIMVGPGTGVAPFIGFLEHRKLQRQTDGVIGEMFLYFGCRNRASDYLYQETLEDLHSCGILTELNVSFSRDVTENQTKYVQDSMFANKERIVKTLLENDGYLYVCGDAKNMAKNVRDNLVSCFENVLGITEKEALGQIASLVLSKRYLQDIWA